MSIPHRQSLLVASVGPVTAVASFRATPEERKAAHARLEARRILRVLVSESASESLPSLAALVDGGAVTGSIAALAIRVQAALDTGTLLFVPGWSWRPRPAPLDLSVPPEPVIQPPPRATQSRRATFELIVIDRQSGHPLSGVSLQITSPDGSDAELTTTSDGRAKVSALEPGRCSVRSLITGVQVGSAYVFAETVSAPPAAPAPDSRPPAGPAYLVDVGRHRVRSGETPESIERAEGVSWEAIANFNWGTTGGEKLEQRYRDSLGCRRETPDGSRIVFDDADDPGIILIPRPWESSLAIGPVQRLMVSPLRAVVLTLENEVGLRLPGVGYEARFADGARHRGRLGSSGIARVEGVADGPFAVSYPDELDVLATSLAASVRKGFDEQATAPLFTLLMQEQEVIDRASAVYARYFDDLTGRGLAADIDQVVTDPEARRPLLALCVMAGVLVPGTEQVELEKNLPAPVDPAPPSIDLRVEQ